MDGKAMIVAMGRGNLSIFTMKLCICVRWHDDDPEGKSKS